jgi:hypothetical protein
MHNKENSRKEIIEAFVGIYLVSISDPLLIIHTKSNNQSHSKQWTFA